MPRLMLFAPCERAILDRADNSLSLIAIIHELTADIPSTTALPRDAHAPRQWQVVAVWWAEPGDDQKRFQQRVSVVNPDGKVVLQTLTEFDIRLRSHRTVGRINVFPIGVAGEYNLRLEIRELGQEGWTEVSSFPLLVQHRRIMAPKASPA